MGCMRRLGCFLFILAALAAAYMLRDRWLPGLRHRLGAAPAAATTPAQPWDLVTADEGARARDQILKFGQPSGPVFTNVSAAGFTKFIVDSLSRVLPRSAMGTTATVIGDELYIRAMVRPADLGADALGPLKGALAEREPLEIGGTLEVLKPGLGAYTVRSLKIASLDIPSAGIPSILENLAPGARPAPITRDALPLVLPAQVADVRVRNGRITLYKGTP